MSLQNQFTEFHNKIKISESKLSTLREKRDIVIEKLRDSGKLPSFEKLDLGSYSMNTGVEPCDRGENTKDYDIDVGLRFNVNTSEYEENPIELKELIDEILKDHTEYGSEIKQPCVTVKYKKDGELAYHLDLVVYAYEDKDDKNSQLYLSRGKKNSSKENKYWEKADPIGLKNLIIKKYEGDNSEEKEKRAQYRRVIKYLKRWKDVQFSSDGNNEPPGIGITLLVYELFEPSEYDYLESRFIANDFEALKNVVFKIKNEFRDYYDFEKGVWYKKIEYKIPVEPYSNVFSKMTGAQMTRFWEKIDKLHDGLVEVSEESDLIKQCEKLAKLLGDDFPIPKKVDTSKKKSSAIAPSNVSG